MSFSHEKKRIFIALVLVFLGVSGIFASTSVNAQAHVIITSPDRDILRAQHAMRRGEYDIALEHYQKAARKDLSEEHRLVVHNSMCAISYLHGKYREATEQCSKVIEDSPSHWKAYVTRGNAKRALGDFDGALADFCEANKLSPEEVNGAFEKRCIG